mgnify:FL=1
MVEPQSRWTPRHYSFFTSTGVGTIDCDTMMADQPLAPVYRDRSLGLLLFGIAEIAIGLALAVLVPVALVVVSSIETGAGVSATVSIVVVYLLACAVFVAL